MIVANDAAVKGGSCYPLTVSAAEGGGDDRLLAPMPGLVIAVSTEPGAWVGSRCKMALNWGASWRKLNSSDVFE